MSTHEWLVRVITWAPSAKLFKDAPTIRHTSRWLLGRFLRAGRVQSDKAILALICKSPLDAGNTQQLLDARSVPSSCRMWMFKNKPLVPLDLHLGKDYAKLDVFNGSQKLLVVFLAVLVTVDMSVQSLKL